MTFRKEGGGHGVVLLARMSLRSPRRCVPYLHPQYLGSILRLRVRTHAVVCMTIQSSNLIDTDIQPVLVSSKVGRQLAVATPRSASLISFLDYYTRVYLTDYPPSVIS